MTEPLFSPTLDTYEALTAESILAYAHVHLSREELAAQMAERDTFYASLVQIPSKVVFNSLLNTQCRDLQSYSQERLIEYILSGIENTMTSEPEVELKNNVETRRLELIQLGADLTEVENTHYQMMLDIYVLQEKQALEWSNAAEAQAEKLWPLILECKPDVSLEQKNRLVDYLKRQAAGVVISPKELKNIRFENEPSASQKAIIQWFLDQDAKACPNVMDASKTTDMEMRELQQKLKNEREEFRLKVEGVRQSLVEKNTQLSALREIINGLLLNVNEAVDAFKPSDDTLNNNLNMNHLDDLGLKLS